MQYKSVDPSANMDCLRIYKDAGSIEGLTIFAAMIFSDSVLCTPGFLALVHA